jgi:hypothetical protein
VTALATETTAPRIGSGAEAGRLFESPGSTLEDKILGAWEDLELKGRSVCPVCRDPLEPGGCAGCGSQLT